MPMLSLLIPPSPPTTRALEFKRTTTSMSLSEEKAILREIAQIKTVKSQLETYNDYENKIQDKKVNRPCACRTSRFSDASTMQSILTTGFQTFWDSDN